MPATLARGRSPCQPRHGDGVRLGGSRLRSDRAPLLCTDGGPSPKAARHHLIPHVICCPLIGHAGYAHKRMTTRNKVSLNGLSRILYRASRTSRDLKALSTGSSRAGASAALRTRRSAACSLAPDLAHTLEMTERKVPAESNRKKMQRLQTDDALTLFDAGKLRIPSDARLAEPDVYGRPQATIEGQEAIVEYQDDGGWQLASVYWETYQAILKGLGEVG